MSFHAKSRAGAGDDLASWLASPKSARTGLDRADWKVLFDRCPGCEALDSTLAFVHKDCGEVVRCTGCGLRYVRSRRLAPWIQLRRDEVRPLPSIILEKEEEQTPDFDAVLSQLEREGASGRLLEIGAMTGHFQALARKRGWDAMGLEPDPWAAEYARRNLGVDVRATTVAEAGLETDGFDAVVMLHVMEHLTDPLDTLRELRRVLKPTGVLAIEIPIVDAAAVRLMGRRHRHFVFDHTLFMTRDTCGALLERAGFRVGTRQFVGRHIGVGRFARSLAQRRPVLGKPLVAAVSAVRLDKTAVWINLRDNMRVYARPIPD